MKKAYCMSSFFSVTRRSLRKPCSHDSVRSATQRNTPNPLPCAVYRDLLPKNWSRWYESL